MMMVSFAALPRLPPPVRVHHPRVRGPGRLACNGGGAAGRGTHRPAGEQRRLCHTAAVP